VVEPTPTPVPPPPAPNITKFVPVTLNASDLWPKPLTPKVWYVKSGTEVTVQWEVDGDPEVIVLTCNGDVFESTDAIGSAFLGEVTDAMSCNLKAENEGGIDTDQLQLLIGSADPPPGPTNFVYHAGTPGWFSWNYGDSVLIDGFRLYSTLSSDPVADEDVLPDPNGPVYNWNPVAADLTGKCNAIFYLVAIYTDDEANTKETDSAGNSWFVPCP
jgi:hypothetical protein